MGLAQGQTKVWRIPWASEGLSYTRCCLTPRSFRSNCLANLEGDTGSYNDFAEKSFQNLGAWIMDRNMFGPVRGPWPNQGWKGWWGDNHPYHTPVFVLTHHAREALEMAGGTTFYFVTDGIQSALNKAKRVAKGKDVRIGGGLATVREYLKAELIDEIHLAYSPVFLVLERAWSLASIYRNSVLTWLRK